MKQKIIGIIGGVGPQATVYLYDQIIQYSQTKYHAQHNDDYPHVIIESVPVPDFISNTEKMSEALAMLKETVKRFESSGVDRICIASNTIHILLPELQALTSIPFLSIIELVSKRCKSYEYQTVGLVGTPVLTDSKLYEKMLKTLGISLITPTKEELKIVDAIIRGVMAGKNSFTNKDEYIGLINSLFAQGAEGIILGCTELPLAIDYTVLGKKAVNSDGVLAQAIADYYYQE